MLLEVRIPPEEQSGNNDIILILNIDSRCIMKNKERVVVNLYTQGLLGIAERKGITLQQAADEVVEYCKATQNEEHIPSIVSALEILTTQQVQRKKKL